jgi:hypothetical protein
MSLRHSRVSKPSLLVGGHGLLRQRRRIAARQKLRDKKRIISVQSRTDVAANDHGAEWRWTGRRTHKPRAMSLGFGQAFGPRRFIFSTTVVAKRNILAANRWFA